jgi:hypothetical protein
VEELEMLGFRWQGLAEHGYEASELRTKGDELSQLLHRQGVRRGVAAIVAFEGDQPKDVGGVLSSLSSIAERTVVIGQEATGTDEWDCLPPAPDATDQNLAGLLAAMRWQPHVSWIIVKQASPAPSEDELRQLLAARRPGVWAATPESRGLLYVDFRAGATVEALATKNTAGGSDFHKDAAETIMGALAPGMEEADNAGDEDRNSGRS